MSTTANDTSEGASILEWKRHLATSTRTTPISNVLVHPAVSGKVSEVTAIPSALLDRKLDLELRISDQTKFPTNASQDPLSVGYFPRELCDECTLIRLNKMPSSPINARRQNPCTLHIPTPFLRLRVSKAFLHWPSAGLEYNKLMTGDMRPPPPAGNFHKSAPLQERYLTYIPRRRKRNSQLTWYETTAWAGRFMAEHHLLMGTRDAC